MPISKEALNGKTAWLEGRGVTSGKQIGVEVSLRDPGHGIVFEVQSDGSPVRIPATANFVIHTLRNVVLGHQGARLCLVEHFLAAAALWGLNDLLVKVDGPELPLGDGSAQFWASFFERSGWKQKAVSSSFQLTETVVCRKGDRMLIATPDEAFSISYLMDWDHPQIGKRWQTWRACESSLEILPARTFGSLKEHQLLGIQDTVVSLTEDGFSQPLRFPDEPVRHKLLDLLGDLMLTGVNPLSLKARIISIKGGHELDVDLARRLTCLMLATP